MLADSFVYEIGLFAVCETLIKKKRIAKLAGYFKLALRFLDLKKFYVGYLEK